MKNEQPIIRAKILLAKATMLGAGLICMYTLFTLYTVFHLEVIRPGLQDAENKNTTQAKVKIPSQLIKDGIHTPTGFIYDDGLELVIAHCTVCHSSKLVTQNRASEQGWIDMIRWMQASQNLWDLGRDEETVVKYLAKNYAPENNNRRKPLFVSEWYYLQNK